MNCDDKEIRHARFKFCKDYLDEAIGKWIAKLGLQNGSEVREHFTDFGFDNTPSQLSIRRATVTAVRVHFDARATAYVPRAMSLSSCPLPKA